MLDKAREYVIQTQKDQKGRSFRGVLATGIVANGLFDEGASGETIRPIWALFLGSEAELRPFMANLKVGRKAEPFGGSSKKSDGERLEFLRSVGFQIAWQREPEGSMVTIYHPELFRLDPGMVDPAGIKFVLLVPPHWEAQQKVDREKALEHTARLGYTQGSDLVEAAYLFAAYLDRRTRCPLVADGRFYLQLLLAALDQGMASFPGSGLQYQYGYHDHPWGYHKSHWLQAEGLQYIGNPKLISVKTSHEAFEIFLAEQVELYFQQVNS